MFLAFFLSSCGINLNSCGIDTKDWPVIKIDLDSSEISSVSVDFNKLVDSKNNRYEHGYKITYNEEAIQKNLALINGYPYKKELEKKVNLNSYYVKILFEITMFDSTFYKVIFINYGVADGVVSFVENEYHFLPGYIDTIYDDFVE